MTRTVRRIAGVVVAIGLGGGAACVLADPPAQLPVGPIEPPEIDRVSVVPPIPSILNAWPAQFVVPVAADPRETAVDLQFLVDQVVLYQRRQDVEADGGVLISFAPPVPPGAFALAECHTLEVRVEYDDSSGEDDAAWFYTPTGDGDQCPTFDAGHDAGDEGDD